MKWLGGKRRPQQPAPPDAHQAPGGAEPAVEIHRSLALAQLLGELRPEQRLSVLDLGPAVGANLSFLSERFRCRLRIADLWSSADRGRRIADPDVDPAALMRDLIPAEGEPLDLILGWDLVNYLGKPQIRALAGCLAPACRPGARWFLMALAGQRIPREPLTYELREGGDLVYRDGGGEATRPGPRYRPAEIDEMTPGFSVDRSYLLRHGVQEYLLIRD